MKHTQAMPNRTFSADELLMKGGAEGQANETRMELLFSASDGMTTEDAVLYLEYGAEMVKLLRNIIDEWESPDGVTWHDVEGVYELIAKMEGK